MSTFEPTKSTLVLNVKAGDLWNGHGTDVPFTSRSAHRVGIESSRLRARDLVHPFHSVHVTAPPRTVRDLCLAYRLVMPEGAFFSHGTAAALLGVPLPGEGEEHSLHVAVQFPRSPPRARGVIGHSLGRLAGRMVDGLPISSPAHVWCQLSGVIAREDLVAVGDFLVGSRTRVPVVQAGELAELSGQLFRTKGAQARTWALPRIRPGTDSRPETLLRLFLEEHGFAGLEVNRPVRVAGGRVVLHPDLSIPVGRIAFEYEGDGHRVDRRQWRLDIERRELLESEGWKVVRVTATDLFADRPGFIARLRRFVPKVAFPVAEGHIRHELW